MRGARRPPRRRRREALEGNALPTPPGDDALRALAAEILERPEYARWRLSQSDVARWFVELVTQFLGWLDRLAGESPWLYALVLASLAAFALLLLAHIAWSIRAALRMPAPSKRRARTDERPRFAEEAHALALQGRYLEASQRLQLASLELLLEGGTIELGRHESNRTLRARLADSRLPGELRAALTRSLDELQARWFREHRADRGLYERWCELHARLRDGEGAA